MITFYRAIILYVAKSVASLFRPVITGVHVAFHLTWILVLSLLLLLEVQMQFEVGFYIC